MYPEYSQNGEEYGSSPYPYVYRSNLGNNIGEDVDYASGFGGGFGVLRDNGYTIAYYVERYINTLKSMGAPPTVTGRLLSHEEAVSLGCDGTFSWDNNIYCSSVDEENNPTSGNAPDWVYSSSYWLGSASYYTNTWRIATTGKISYDISFLEGDTGVRPVIVIPTSTLN